MQQTLLFEDTIDFDKFSLLIFDNEKLIDPESTLYLITWSPDPSNLPESDFRYQHLYNVNLLSDYLKSCASGLWCVESTQKGNPHYHGWYQVHDDYELARIAHQKTLEKFGNTKITPARTWKIFSWSERKNALYYYKKDFTTFCSLPHPVIDEDSKDDTDWNYKSFFDVKGDKQIIDKISDRKYYLDFYKNSDL